MDKTYMIRLRQFNADSAGIWTETFSTIEEAQARIDEVNVEGSTIVADTDIRDISVPVDPQA